jgi:hypothetical protein
VRHWALAALITPAFVACALDRAGLGSDAALDATSSGGATSSGDTATTGGGSSSTDGSSPPATGGGGGAGGGDPSAGGAGGSPSLECWGPDTICCANAIPCPTATMECCLSDQYSGELAICVARGTCPDLAINCDDSEDCAGSICCIDWNGFNYQGVECKETCNPPNNAGDPGKYPMCNWDDGTCPAGLQCNYDVYVGEVGWGYCF